MQRGETIPGVKVFSHKFLSGEETFTSTASEANYYRDGEWDVFGGDEWYLDDDEDSFFQSDAEDIFLALDEEGDGDASSWVSEEDGRLVRTYARVRREAGDGRKAESFMLADDMSDEYDEDRKKEDDESVQSWWLGEDEELDNRIKIYMFANESGDNEPSSKDEDERRRTIHMEDYL